MLELPKPEVLWSAVTGIGSLLLVLVGFIAIPADRLAAAQANLRGPFTRKPIEPDLNVQLGVAMLTIDSSQSGNVNMSISIAYFGRKALTLQDFRVAAWQVDAIGMPQPVHSEAGVPVQLLRAKTFGLQIRLTAEEVRRVADALRQRGPQYTANHSIALKATLNIQRGRSTEPVYLDRVTHMIINGLPAGFP